MFLQILLLICSICNTYGVASTASPSCASDEYRVGQVCCLACPGGYRVRRDCTATTSSLCSKCPDGTFKEGLSGQKQCSACTKCDPGLGLKVKKSCSSTSDAVCEALDGFICSDSNGGGCRTAQRHNLSCSPGHYFGRGTADKDIECLHCADGSFSDGTSSSCQNHIKCDFVGGVQIKPGTDSTDSTCIKYVTIVFIIGCISFIIVLVEGAWVYKRYQEKKKTLQLFVEFEKQIDEMETPDQMTECYTMYNRLQVKNKTPEQERKLQELIDRYNKKKETLELDRELTEFEEQIDKMETPKQERACYTMYNRLQSKNKTTEQERKFKELVDRLMEKRKTLKRERAHYGGAAGEGTSGPSSTPPLCPELPAGLETSSPPAPSSETQPAEETTPLMSSESPEPTRDQQEHTSRTTTPDGHDDDQSLGPEVIRRDIGASQSIPSTSQSIPSTSQSFCRSGAGERDIEMGPVPGSDHKSHKST